MRMGRFEFQDLRRFQEKLNRLGESEINAFVESCTKALATRLLRMVIKRTPVRGGTLRKGWTGSRKQSAKNYAESLTVNHFGDTYVVEIINPIEYASYVEYGHRTVNHKGWVPGRFMMTISEQELRQIAPRVLERKIKEFLGGVFHD